MLGLSSATMGGLGYKSLAKIKKSIVWESIGCMELAIKSNACLFLNCMLYILYTGKIQ